MKSISQLVALQRHRLAQVERSLREARHSLVDKQIEQDRHRMQLYAHCSMAKERERELYASVFDHVVKRHTVDHVKESLAALRRQEQQLQEALAQADCNVAEQQEQVKAAQYAYARQLARTEKYLELHRRFDAMAHQVRQLKEDMEIEEQPQRR